MLKSGMNVEFRQTEVADRPCFSNSKTARALGIGVRSLEGLARIGFLGPKNYADDIMMLQRRRHIVAREKIAAISWNPLGTTGKLDAKKLSEMDNEAFVDTLASDRLAVGPKFIPEKIIVATATFPVAVLRVTNVWEVETQSKMNNYRYMYNAEVICRIDNTLDMNSIRWGDRSADLDEDGIQFCKNVMESRVIGRTSGYHTLPMA